MPDTHLPSAISLKPQPLDTVVETGGWTPEKNLVERVLLKPLVAVVGAVDAVIGLEVLKDKEKKRGQSHQSQWRRRGGVFRRRHDFP